MNAPKFLPWLEILREEVQAHRRDRKTRATWLQRGCGLCYNMSRMYRIAAEANADQVFAMRRQRDELMVAWFYAECEALGLDCDVAEKWEVSAADYPVEAVMRVVGYTSESPAYVYNHSTDMYVGVSGLLRLSLLDYIIEHWKE